MEYFKDYVSNTIAGSGNQRIFQMPADQVYTGRVFYKITVAGKYPYSLLFSNTIDSTFANGTVSYKNIICDQWQIHWAKIGKAKMLSQEPVSEMTAADFAVSQLQEVTFGGCREKTVMPGEFFATDPIMCSFQKGEYLCLEMCFSGTILPYHEESLLPIFRKEKDAWVYNRQMPLASMVGCQRTVAGRVGFIGDSITQGIGTEPNAYDHWNAILTEKLPEQYAFWNLGLGYGRASDMASGGAWYFKAKQNDIVFVCYGVNDILQGFDEEQIKKDLLTIVSFLKQDGKTVILQTVPPFNYQGEMIEKWQRINRYIQEELSQKVDLVFDNVPFLGQCPDKPYAAKYGGHPNGEGCAVWAEELYRAVNGFFKE